MSAIIDDNTIGPSEYLFLNKKTMIIGPSASGKTTMILDILRAMSKSFVEYFIVTNDPSSYVHLSDNIRSALGASELQELWEKASYHKITSEICNNGKVLASLCHKIDNYNQVNNIPPVKYQKGPNFAHLKQKIRDNDAILTKLKLEPDEYVACHKLDTNSKICLVIDGGVSLLDDWKKYKQDENVALHLTGLADFKDITMIISCDNDNNLSSGVFRKMNNILFASKNTLSICVNKTSRSFPIKKRKELLSLADQVFGKQNHNKIMVNLNSMNVEVIRAEVERAEVTQDDQNSDKPSNLDDGNSLNNNKTDNVN